MSESTLLIFWIVFLFFILNFLARVGLEQNSGVEFFALFLCLSHPILAKNNAINRFFNFLIFFFYFFRNFLARVEYERNSGLNLFSLFLRLPHPILAKNNAGKEFFNFFLFFSEFSCLLRVWTEFGSKIFFSLSPPISSHFG